MRHKPLKQTLLQTERCPRAHALMRNEIVGDDMVVYECADACHTMHGGSSSSSSAQSRRRLQCAPCGMPLHAVATAVEHLACEWKG